MAKRTRIRILIVIAVSIIVLLFSLKILGTKILFSNGNPSSKEGLEMVLQHRVPTLAQYPITPNKSIRLRFSFSYPFVSFSGALVIAAFGADYAYKDPQNQALVNNLYAGKFDDEVFITGVPYFPTDRSRNRVNLTFILTDKSGTYEFPAFDDSFPVLDYALLDVHLTLDSISGERIALYDTLHSVKDNHE